MQCYSSLSNSVRRIQKVLVLIRKQSSNEAPKKPLFQYNTCVTREISDFLPEHALRMSKGTVVDIARARQQHVAMSEALLSAGVDLLELPSDNLPDSVFIEDVAVVIDKKALIANVGAVTRRFEIPTVKDYLLSLPELKILDMTEKSTGTLDGGDVLFTGTEIFVGLSKRTNRQGAKILQEFFSEYPVHTIDLSKFPDSLHLKSACSICGPGAVAVGGVVGKHIENAIITFSGANKYRFFPTEDMYAANCLYINDVLIRRHLREFPASAVGFKLIDDFVSSSGGTVVEIEADELAKVDGALTCCSLLMDI